MSYVSLEFECASCEITWDDLVETKDRRSECPSCGVASTTTLFPAPHVGTYTAMSREDRIASLKKRSQDHSKKLLKQNEGKFFPGK